MTREELRDRLCVLLGGRSAEEVALGAISTGAQDDLERATLLAGQMVRRFGMSDTLGPATWGRSDGGRFLGPQGEMLDRDYSEETARLIDAEVKRILDEEHTRAQELMRGRREALDAIATELLARETLERGELEAIVRSHSGKAAVAPRAATA
jgi:cell division protease FtsH